MPMTEVSTSSEFTPKRRITTEFVYDGELLVTQLELIEEIAKVEDRVLSVKSVPHEEVDSLIDAGYQPESYFVKNVIMVLTESTNEAVMGKLKAQIDSEPQEKA